jgi:bifunctional non-homologous end joining protein LigD
MLATNWPQAFDDPGWWFEIKWDGYRAVVSADGGKVKVRSRRGLDLLGPFPELGLLPIPDGVALDGEVVAFDEMGRPSFSYLQQRTGFGGRGTKSDVGVNLVVFDVLFRAESVIGLPYEERRGLLSDLGLPSPIIVPDPVPESGNALMAAAREQGLEGVVGKRLGSTYAPGRRSPDWRKVAVRRRLRAVIGGYSPGDRSRSSTFGSVLVGLYDDQGLRFIGAVGSGFNEGSLEAFTGVLHDTTIDESPFYNPVALPRPVKPLWVEPRIVVEVEFKEWTHDDHLRAPVYKGVVMIDPELVTWAEEGPVSTPEGGSTAGGGEGGLA